MRFECWFELYNQAFAYTGISVNPLPRQACLCSSAVLVMRARADGAESTSTL
jgi:hypothetical protein